MEQAFLDQVVDINVARRSSFGNEVLDLPDDQFELPRLEVRAAFGSTSGCNVHPLQLAHIAAGSNCGVRPEVERRFFGPEGQSDTSRLLFV